MTEEYDKQPKCPECGYPVDDCHCNGDGNTVDEEDDNYNWDYYDEPMDEDSWNINNDEQQEQEETPAQQDNNQSQNNTMTKMMKKSLNKNKAGKENNPYQPFYYTFFTYFSDAVI